MQNKNLAKLIDIMNSLDQNDISYDDRGRMIIRTHYHQAFRNDTIQSSYSRDIKNKELLAARLLYPEDRVVRQPLITWTNALLSNVRELCSSSIKPKHGHKIAEIYNNAALILFCVDDYKAARELCYSQIQLFISWSNQTKNRALLKYVFQPWINLSRIDRIEGHFYEALNKLNALNLSTQHEIIMGENKLLTKSLFEAIKYDDEVDLVIKTSLILEPIKGYLSGKHYSELIYFIKNRQQGIGKIHHALIQEASAIGLANTGKVKEALDLLNDAKSHSDPAVMHVFNLRECEIRAALAANDSHDKELLLLAAMTTRLLNEKYININDIHFGLHTAAVMKKAGFIDDAIKLIYYCLQAADAVNDEILKAQCLCALYAFSLDDKAQKLVKNMMTNLFFHTQYPQARNLLINCYPDLRDLENKLNHQRIHLLYEELLSNFPTRINLIN